MRILSSFLGSLYSDPFKITVLAANNYIPIYAFHTSYGENGIEFYTRPSLKERIMKKPNTLKHIKDALETAITPRVILIGGKNYIFMKGAIYTEEGIPLMVLGMSTEAYKNPDIRNFSELRYGKEINPVDNKNFVLFYSTSFFTEPSLAPLNRRFQKELLMSCYEKGIEVRVITSSEIERNTFANIFEIPKANSVDQLEEYMNRVLPTFLYTEEEDTFVFEELRVPEVVQNHELSVEEEALLFDSEAREEIEEVLEEAPYYVDPVNEIEAELESLRQEALEYENSLEIRELDREVDEIEAAHTDSAYIAPVYPLVPEESFFQTVTGEQVVTTNFSSRTTRFIELIDDTE
jgi:hypothetical protein